MLKAQKRRLNTICFQKYNYFSRKNARMRTRFYIPLVLLSTLFVASCSTARKSTTRAPVTKAADIKRKVKVTGSVAPVTISTGNVEAARVVDFAKTLIGTPYKYGAADKKSGFDCSGFIHYVFNHFQIAVPRISYQFTNAGREINIKDSQPGDLILFTGSDPSSGMVGHMGIVTGNENGEVEFIHASSSRGVMISGMNSYFVPRFVKVNRIFKR